MNQPTSRCFGWVDNLVQIGELLEQEAEEKNTHNSPQLVHRQPATEWNTDNDTLDVDTPDETHGEIVEEYPGAAAVFVQRQKTFLDRFDQDQFSHERCSNLYYPFASRADWEFGLWLTRSSLSMAAIDNMLSLELVGFTIT
jgi:hypothetical protein